MVRSSGNGTIITSICTLLNASVGTGILTLPYSYKCLGIIGGIIFTVLYGLAMGLSLHVYVKSAHREGASSITQLIGIIFGQRVRKYFDVCLILYCMLTCVGCFIVLADVSKPFLDIHLGENYWLNDRKIIMTTCGTLMLPLLFLRRINMLRFSAILGICCIMYVSILVCYSGVYSWQQEEAAITIPEVKGFTYLNLFHYIFYMAQ